MKSIIFKSLILSLALTLAVPIQANDDSFDYYFPRIMGGLFVFAAACLAYSMYKKFETDLDSDSDDDESYQDRVTTSRSAQTPEEVKPKQPVVNADSSVAVSLRDEIGDNTLEHSGILAPLANQGVAPNARKNQSSKFDWMKRLQLSLFYWPNGVFLFMQAEAAAKEDDEIRRRFMERMEEDRRESEARVANSTPATRIINPHQPD